MCGQKQSDFESLQRLGCQHESLDRCYHSSCASSYLIDLLDQTASDAHVPDLYQSDQSSVSEDDLTDLGDPLPDLPKIDLGLYGRKLPEPTQDERPLRFSVSGRDSYFRYFLDNKMGSSGALNNKPHLSLYQADTPEAELGMSSRLPSVNDIATKRPTIMHKNSLESIQTSEASGLWPIRLLQNGKLQIGVEGTQHHANAYVPKCSTLSHACEDIETYGKSNISIGRRTTSWVCNTNAGKQIPYRNLDKSMGPFQDRVNATAVDTDSNSNKPFEPEVKKELTISTNETCTLPKDSIVPDYFRWGVSYRPISHEISTSRSLCLTNLPADVNLSTLLDKVRGGLIVTARLLDSRKITNSFSALITFVHEESAMAYDGFIRKNPITFNGRQVQVQLLRTPTWPMSCSLRTAVNLHRHTRCLEVFGFPRSITLAEIRQDLQVHRVVHLDGIESMQLRDDDVLELRFSSIEYAGKARDILSTWKKYRGCVVSFARDPCAIPLETMLSYRHRRYPSVGMEASEEPLAEHKDQ